MSLKNGAARTLLSAFFAVITTAWAAGGPNFPAAGAETHEEHYNDLVGGDVQKAVDAARKMGEIKSDRALEMLMETLMLGAPPKLAVELIRAMARHRSQRAFDLIAHYCKNRNVDVRAEALKALGRLAAKDNIPRVFSVAMNGLRDSASSVREAAAHLLVDLNKRGLDADRREEAEKVLLELLLKHRDHGSAAAALGHFGGMETARTLAVNLQDQRSAAAAKFRVQKSVGIPSGVVIEIYSEFLKREDFGPEPVRVWILKTLSTFTEPEAIAAIMHYVATTRGKNTPSVALARRLAER